MKREIQNLRARLYLLSAAVLVIGWGAASWVYLTAANDSGRVLRYEMVDGESYPVSPEDSKRYQHDLELYGGTLNELAVEFTSWFVGLWQGRRLAFTLGALAALISTGLFLFARFLLVDLESEVPVRKDSDRLWN